jgi:hypothetical protein
LWVVVDAAEKGHALHRLPSSSTCSASDHRLLRKVEVRANCDVDRGPKKVSNQGRIASKKESGMKVVACEW